MKKNIFTFITSLCTLSAFSQDSLLKTFKFRNSNFRAISLNVGAGSQFDRQELGSGTQKNSIAAGGFTVSYYMAKSTDKILLLANAGLGANFSASKSTDPIYIDKSRSYSVQPQVTILNKWFKKERFLELGATSLASSAGTKLSTTNQLPSKNQQDFFSVTLNTGIGIGRLENITDMQNALWLNKALQKVNSLTHALSSTELNELGRAITTANNTRILDDRKRVQFILATVDNYFQRKGLITKNDITYFSNLNDILFFAFNTPRLSGTEKFIRFSPTITGYSSDLAQNNITDRYKAKIYNKGALLSIGINKYAPYNLTHQNNYGVSINLNYVSLNSTQKYFTSGNLTNQTLLTPDVRQAYLKLFYEHAIYPNTRTIISFNLQSQGGYQDVNKQNSFFESVAAFASANYFISYRTRFTCGAGVYYSNNVTETSQYLYAVPDSIQLYANAGFTINI